MSFVRTVCLRCGCQLAHRYRLAGEQRFVHAQPVGRDQQGISGHPVAFVQLQQVTANHVAPGDALGLAIADDQGARAGQVAQGFDGAFGLAFLVERETERDQHEAEQRQAFLQVAEHEVQSAGCQ